MPRYTSWLFAAALLPVAACSSSNNNAPMTAAAPPPPALSQQDQTFANAAAATDATEIQSSQLAATKARGARVKQYANKIVSDHQAADKQLMTILQSKGATSDATLNAMESSYIAAINGDKPGMFDRDYLRGQIAGHEAAIKAFNDEIANGTDPDLKSYAQTTLPTLKQHLAMARRLAGMRG